MKIVVLGATGQLASSFKKVAPSYLDVTYLSHAEAPFENYDMIERKLNELNPTHVINTVAYTKVDLAESERDLCFLINYETPVKIAKWCKQNNALFVHYSTDYVFNGKGEKPWIEDDPTDPLNVYGMSKMRSEKEILALECAYVFRTSWVYSEFGQNFVKTMVKFFQERETLNIVSNQIGTPNYAPELASATFKILESQNKLGLYHLSAQGECSWYDFALKIKEYCEELGLKLTIGKLNPILSKDYVTPARRPLNSRLSSEKLYKEFSVRLPSWEDSLKQCVSELLKG